MTFLRGGNRHDSWLRFCERNRDLATGTGLPEWIAHSEHRFPDLLRDGSATAPAIAVELSDLSASQWGSLERLAEIIFLDYESYAPLDLFPAFRREVQRRDSGFAWPPFTELKASGC